MAVTPPQPWPYVLSRFRKSRPASRINLTLSNAWMSCVFPGGISWRPLAATEKANTVFGSTIDIVFVSSGPIPVPAKFRSLTTTESTGGIL